MSVRNHNLLFRPLQGGIAIYNPNAGGVGTLGLVATSDGQDRWVVSCYHVLGRPNGELFNDDELIYQPTDTAAGSVVAKTVANKSDASLDCAAARVEPGVQSNPTILGLPPLAAPTVPAVGMRVIKSGRETGVTEGVIWSILGDQVVIRVGPGFPPGYNLCDIGDSGAIWVDRTTGAPVALHTAGNTNGIEQAFGVRFTTVLNSLGLHVIP